MPATPKPFEIIEDGTLTSVAGIRATGLHCGVKRKRHDLALIYSAVPTVAAAAFTTNKVNGPSILVCKENLKTPDVRAIIVVSGNANTCTGKTGLENAREKVSLTAQNLGLKSDEVLVSSTGIIGRPLPMDQVRKGIGRAAKVILRWTEETSLDPSEHGHLAARAILTTDAYPKEIAVRVKLGRKTVTLAGICKGAGMIAPNMATMLCYMATDAAIAPRLLQPLLKDAVERSFNSISVDGDTSTSDTAVLLSNGLAGNAAMDAEGKDYARFRDALHFVTRFLAQQVVRDGEGATRLMEICVRGAASDVEAKRVGMTVASSLLWKCAVFGGDPNWGRIAAAVGRAPARVKQERLVVKIGNQTVFADDSPTDYNLKQAESHMQEQKIHVTIELGLGNGEWTVWGSDLSYDYVKLNAEYHT
ncbi:MAG: bifunctional ornithine acetyltransferase/N-acetylglutamate synthase [Armatimonadetes bacterium CG2_30_59_28]|nr:bifunctional glutamate N-acetyltransferase/amino-acid acetyltransferase ArgJ [Armatimonadota bacterium]OIO96938.1 MAG: bifunctional ornithine acetyltransferase/N-acetylglutamate synthase [Armatimonadetes bacterium CG2_30_59_28]PIU65016.1 MAG: hypothetical protein COS85_10345 [Armatimonadetes bacterium CG07_land_8_20_14_0_80_59_28]PIX38564.1 MAG: hypothetical protein COZ56_20130 [Armatimonadetes bacterium CG_4_8_14_3_um_filter_58_9]PIY40356.1 MAG: hypothetical protein COZ05_17635 [Armatimonad